MDTTAIVKVAVATVGVTQLLKSLIPVKKGWIWAIITVIVGVGISAAQYLCPAGVVDTIIAVSGATIFYDTIYQTFEKIFKRGDKDE